VPRATFRLNGGRQRARGPKGLFDIKMSSPRVRETETPWCEANFNSLSKGE
jgi:hypothetical protein